METPFRNDPFAILWATFNRLFPGKHCVCYWDPQMQCGEVEAYGLTHFDDDGTITVTIDATLAVEDALEVFGHELAHVAAGVGHEHDEVWENAFTALQEAYMRELDEVYDQIVVQE